ncbi:MAG: UDP-N-acetylmuramoyl-tripeptide--D-alanyl-D-alanine ligase [Bacteroidales bacterium]
MKDLYQPFLGSAGICTDSRSLFPDCFFVALKGENFDGNRFVKDALDRGCKFALTEDPSWKGHPKVGVVDDTLRTLQDLARMHRLEKDPRVVALTGSNGKTTTKELTAAVLATRYRVLAAPGNLNNHIGGALTPPVVEGRGSGRSGDGGKPPRRDRLLASIAAPDLGLITNVGKAHLEGFGSPEGVLKAKSELYAYLAAHDGTALVDGGDGPLLNRALELGATVKRIGRDEDLFVEATLVRQQPFLELEVVLAGERHGLTTRLVGAYNLQNIKYALAIGLEFGVPSSAMLEAVSDYVPRNQRSEYIRGNRNQIILDAYNANPSSMREAIRSFLDYGRAPGC